LDAVFEDGVLRLIEPLSLAQYQRVRVAVNDSPSESETANDRQLPLSIRATLEAEGGCWTEDQLAQNYPQLVSHLQNGKALSVQMRGVTYVPCWQFVDGKIDPEIAEVREALGEAGYGPWEQLVFFLTPRLALHEAHPLNAIRGGKVAEAIETIASFAEQGAE